MEGISVVICCHNGAVRLPTTLTRLQMQEAPSAPWEVVIVDNASSDNTAELARSCWKRLEVPLRIISEPRLGVRYARERGFSEARYDFLGFVDDDNWVARDWVRNALHTISSDPSLGAVGSIVESVCQFSPPAWFEDFHSSYAILTDEDFKRVEKPLSYLPTAGLCIRKRAWTKLIENGFRFHLTGTVGKKLQGGEDTELTMALRLGGWRLTIDPRLRLQHYMPGNRLTWLYLRRLLRNYSSAHVVLDAYTEHSLSFQSGGRVWISDHWLYQLGKALKRLAARPGSAIVALLSTAEGRKDVLELEQLFGRTLALLKLRGRYGAVRREVRDARWRGSTKMKALSAGSVT